MGDVFRGWHRKLGMLTLVMACVFMGGWIRSSTRIDSVNLLGRDTYRPFLASSQMGISVFVTPEKFFKWVAFESTSTKDISPSLLEEFPFKRYEGRWQWKWNGFRYGDAEYQCGPRHTRAFWIWTVPYWSIVIPLTVLSGFLLLSRPRNSTQKKVVESVPAKSA